MPTFAVLQCVKCEWEVYAEAGGLRPWDGKCPKCKTNAWTFLVCERCGKTTTLRRGFCVVCRHPGKRPSAPEVKP